ncbi:hypothetical protein [Paraflavitalea pollutisoli]|uniref:hypothetical protein n=1 Tax=Paraflavitalea pollutisoli TaxID=3034143 RepID=UPI0023EDB07A|nr:hypothetical protein [Paraflavitalea sp. H1-2-19X]
MMKDVLYAMNCLCFAIMIGGAVYEHLNVVPVWSSAPPVSLSMFQGPYGLKPELFWKIIHPVNLILFALTLILHWKTGRAGSIGIAFTGYVVILVITFLYFVPSLIAIITATYGEVADADLTRQARLWEQLSLVRLCVLVVLAMVLLTGMARSRDRVTKVTTFKSA